MTWLNNIEKDLIIIPGMTKDKWLELDKDEIKTKVKEIYLLSDSADDSSGSNSD